MLNLEMIEKSSKTLDGAALAAYGRRWLPALVAELTQAREELAAVDESLGDFYAPVLNPETEEPCGSFWKDHGVNVMRQELKQARAEIERLRAERTEIGRAFDWLWGFWDGNTLVAASAADREEIQKAFVQLANAIGPNAMGSDTTQELELARAEIERPRALVPPNDEYYSYAELPQAWRIEEER